jgi:hypothetical protein
MPKIAPDERIGRRLRFRDLQVFFAVVESGSMAKAAVRLGLTQPGRGGPAARERGAIVKSIQSK